MISIVVVSYRCSEVVQDCIASCLAEMHDNDEVIVFENSGDVSLKAYEQVNPRISVHVSTENIGFTRAVNACLQSAINPWRLVLNPDVRLVEGALDTLRTTLQTAPQRIYCIELLDAPGLRQSYYRRFPSLRGLIVMFFVPARFQVHFRSYRSYTYHGEFQHRTSFEQPPGAGLVLPVGRNLDERYFLYGSDLQICWDEWQTTREEIPLIAAQAIHLRGKGGTGEVADRARLRADSALGFYRFFRRTQPWKAVAWWMGFVCGQLIAFVLRGTSGGHDVALRRFLRGQTWER
jgi:hypothetical protein